MEALQHDPSVEIPDPLSPASRGAAWTLIAAIIVFLAILGTIYNYVLPRLWGETIPDTVRLVVREAWQDSAGGTTKMSAPDGSVWYLGATELLSTGHFSRFRGTPAANEPPRLTFRLSAAGQSEVAPIMSNSAGRFTAILVHDRLIACVPASQWTADGLSLTLQGMTNQDANEIFARLTE